MKEKRESKDGTRKWVEGEEESKKKNIRKTVGGQE